MIEVRTTHTVELEPVTLKAVRALLDAVFEGDLGDHDWERSLGGEGVTTARQRSSSDAALRVGYQRT